LTIFSRAFRIALLALKISSRITSLASTSLPAVMRFYSSRLSPLTESGPINYVSGSLFGMLLLILHLTAKVCLFPSKDSSP
jgi:hypothetical protein